MLLNKKVVWSITILYTSIMAGKDSDELELLLFPLGFEF
jgi:hypothetical protein